MKKKVSSESVVKDICRRTRTKYSSEEKIRIVLEGIRGEESIANLCRREGMPNKLYYRWSQNFLEAGKKCLMGTTGMNPATGRPYGDDGLSLMGGGNTGMPPSYAVPPTSGNTGNAPHDFENNYVHDKCYGK